MSKLHQAQRDSIPAIPATRYAFRKEEKEPLIDAGHVRTAIARFNRVKGVTDTERDEAWKRITSAAKKFGVEMKEETWRELSHHGKS